MSPSSAANRRTGKRKGTTSTAAQQQMAKRPRAEPPANPTLKGPHEVIIAQLQPKYDVLTASVISSTQIRKRVLQATSHLAKNGTESSPPPPVVVFYARTAEVCKMITVVEQCKRILAEESKPWFQYNQMFELPEEPKRQDVVEETALDEDAGESSDDDFEVMASRFEQAVLPPAPKRVVKSMRIFLAVQAVPELKTKEGVSLQSGEGA